MPKNSKTITSKTTKKTSTEPTATTDGAPASATDALGLTVRQQQLLARLAPAVGISAAELAAAADIGRSTAQHDLVALEAAGLARREKGVQEGARRSPDQWFHADAADQTAADAPAAPSLEPDTAATHSADTAETAETAVASEPAADATETVGAPDEDVEEPAAEPVATETPDAGAADDASDTGDAASAKGPQETVGDEQGSAVERPAPEPDAEAAASATTFPSIQTQPTPAAAAEKTTERLGKGALRALVEDYLRAHPEDDSTPTKIGKDLGRSAGAVSNALDKLVGENIAVQTSLTPRAFRIAVDAVSTQVDA